MTWFWVAIGVWLLLNVLVVVAAVARYRRESRREAARHWSERGVL